MTRFAIIGFVLTALAMLAAGSMAPGTAQDDVKKPEQKVEPKKVYRNVSTEKLESILKDLKIDFERGKSKDDGVAVYTFEKQGRSLRLKNHGGKDLWIDTEYTAEKITPEMVNEWNVQAKFSRAVRLKGDKGIVSLEAQLDCVGGATDAIIRQFITRFEGEVQRFTQFSKKLVDVRYDGGPDVRKEVRDAR